MTLTFDSDTILVSSHRFISYIYFNLFLREDPGLVTFLHTFFIVFPPLSQRCELQGCNNVFCHFDLVRACACVPACVCKKVKAKTETRTQWK